MPILGIDPAHYPIYMGIDPGVSGAIVVLTPNRVFARPLNCMDRYSIRNFIEIWKDTTITRQYCLIEQVSGFIGRTDKDGNKRNVASAHTMFTLGESYGHLCMALTCSRIQYDEILPKKWQEIIGITPHKKGETQPQFKRRLKEKAQELFPEEKITLNTSDAFLIAHICRCKHNG